MSHFFTVVLVPPNVVDIAGYVEAQLAPFSEEIQVPAYKEYLSETDISRMIEHYGITDLRTLAEKIPNWSNNKGGVDERGLYSLSTYNPISKWDWWCIGGRFDGRVRGMESNDNGFNFDSKHEKLENNISLVRELPEGFTCWAILVPDGQWFEKGSMGWWGISHGDDPQWDQKRSEILSAFPDHLAVGCDLHI